MLDKSHRIYEFGPLRMNATERLLFCGQEMIPLTPKVFDTLLVLVENSGRVLTKDDLLEMVWPGTFVQESSLAQNISLLRRALGEAASGSPYIETLPKRGYRFTAEVRRRDNDPADETRLAMLGSENRRGPRIYSAIAIIGLLLVSSIVYVYLRNRSDPGDLIPNTIAVLPFRIIGGQNAPEQLSLGMADALVIKLSKLEKPVVLPTSSVARYATGDRDALSIGKELGVDDVITGTLQRSGDQVRLSAQLVRLSDGKTMWSGTFDEGYGSDFAMEDSISDRVADALISCPAQSSGDDPRDG